MDGQRKLAPKQHDKRMKTNLVVLSGLAVALATLPMEAIEAGPFGAQGQGGSRNGQDLRIGPAGGVFELDSFLHLGGLDLNGDDPGRAAKLSRNPLPAGLTMTFASELVADKSDLLLRYTFSNGTNIPFTDVRFFVFLDTEIAEAQNTFFNETAEIAGIPGVGPGDGAPDTWQIDEPGFAGGTLHQNLLEGALNNRNPFADGGAEDIALAIGFNLGTLKPGESVAVRALISEDGSTLGPLSLVHTDPASTPATQITLSGETDPREQVISDLTSQVRLTFEWRLNQPVGSLLGRLRIENTSESGAAVGPPFLLGLESTAGRRYVRPGGTLPNGIPYFDLTAAVAGQLGAGNPLPPGQAVTVDGVEIYSAGRLAPPDSVWSLWGSRVAAPEPAR